MARRHLSSCGCYCGPSVKGHLQPLALHPAGLLLGCSLHRRGDDPDEQAQHHLQLFKQVIQTPRSPELIRAVGLERSPC